jgi:hypothetical protein
MKTNVHENSILTWQEEEARLSKRASRILRFLRAHSCELLTDRQIQQRMGFSERGMVQPRITEMIKAGLVEEIGSTICLVTGKRVRMVRAVSHTVQAELF